MPRRFLKRIMPDHKTMREHPHLQKFGHRLTEPRLWHLNRRLVAAGVALGLFVGFIPIPGQMVVAAALAILFRVNLPTSVMGVWITNPFTMAPIFFFAYKVGAWVMQIPAGHPAFTLTWDWFGKEFLTIWQPFLLGCLICGIVASLLGVLFVRIAWRISVIRSWYRRKHKYGKSERDY